MTQIGALEHLKLENVTLSHQLTETQHRSIKEKERIAVQLQSIEVCPPHSNGWEMNDMLFVLVPKRFTTFYKFFFSIIFKNLYDLCELNLHSEK